LPEPPSQERSACSPGRPGDAHVFGLSAAANPRAALAARRGIFVRRRFSSRGRTVRAAGSRPRVARLLTVEACTLRHRRGTETPWGIHRRPPTSCAHRLRKPDRTSELLALSVARRARGRGLHPRLCQHLPCQARRCRRRFRTTATGRARTPSVGATRALQPERARHACCSRAWPRPAPCRSPRALVCLVKGRRVASSYPGLPRATLPSPARRPALCREKDASHRLLQPTPVTSTLRIARFPVVPPAPGACASCVVDTDSPWA
jgi:hypothetical protein